MLGRDTALRPPCPCRAPPAHAEAGSSCPNLHRLEPQPLTLTATLTSTLILRPRP